MSRTVARVLRDATRALVLLGLLLSALALLPATVHGADVPILATEQIQIVPVGLQVSPAQQTVPKNTATAVNTLLAQPAAAGASLLPPDALVFAELRGPAFGTPVVVTTRPNQPIAIPALALDGLYTLANIRLVSGGRTLLQAVPDTVTITVIDQVLVSQVTSRPLTAQEIQQKGIVVDQNNFQVVNFTAAFGVEANRVSIDFPMILPTQRGLSAPPAAPAVSLPPLQRTTATVTTTQLPTLQLALQVPSVSVSGLLLRVEDPDLEDKFLIPPIPAAIIIPGNIAFLNQFFSVLLMTSNVAPAQSNLVVSDLRATIVLPAGKDLVPPTSGDPLVMAVVGTPPAPQPTTLPVTQAGGLVTIGPGQSGNAEFLVEGRLEGTFKVQINITGTLNGLPVGPVKVSGSAIGMVEVRNPTFALTLVNPATVSAGEEYDFDVIVTNTSQTPANFVNLSLLPRSISGAKLLSNQTVTIETIAPGDSATATFHLLSQQTGTVTSTSFTSEGIPGKFQLTTAVGALGIPMSPNTLVLPPDADALPKALHDAAVGLLGQAFALATSPVTPTGLEPITQDIVYERATDVAAAGQRLRLGEPLLSVVRDLMLDFLGNGFADIAAQFPGDATRQQATQQNYRGFDVLLRASNRGTALTTELGNVFATDVAAHGPLAFQAAFAQATTARPPYLSAITGSKGGAAPVVLNIGNAAGAHLGVTGAGAAVARDIPFGAFFSLNAVSPPQSQLALVAVPDQTTYTVEMLGTATGTVDLGLVVPEGARLRHLTWEDVPIAPGQRARVTFTIGGDNQYILQIDDNGDGVPNRQVMALVNELLTDTGPSLIAAMQVVTGKADLSQYGQLLGLVFSAPISASSSQSGLDPSAITNYAVDGNQVLGVAAQPGSRVILLSLRDGIGPFVARKVTVSGLTDRLGTPMSTATQAITTVLTDGSEVSGQVRRGDGTPVPRARIVLGQTTDPGAPETTVSVKSADDAGGYRFDFVRALASHLQAVDLDTGDQGDVRTQIRAGGQLNIDIIFLGTERLVGKAQAPDGTPLPGAVVRVTSLTNFAVFSAVADSTGAFSLAGIPVGDVTIEAAHVASNSRTVVAATLPTAGGTVVQNLTLIPLTQAQVQTGALKGQVFRSDGATPAVGIPVFTTRGGVATTDASGSYRIDGLVPGGVTVEAIDQNQLTQASVTTTVVGGADITANLILFGGTGTVKGVVLDADGHPVAGALVGGGLSLATTDANGQFSLNNVPIGQRTLTALDQPDQLTASASVNLAGPGEIATVQLSLPARGTLTGRIFEANGTTPVPNLRVFLLGPTNASAVTDAAGAYKFANIPLGTYQISAFRSDFSDGNVADAKLVFKGEVHAVNVAFRGKGKVTGKVLAADGVTPLAARVGFTELQVRTGTLAPPENPFCQLQGNIQVGDVTVEVPQCVPVAIGFGSQHLTRVVNTDVVSGSFTFDNVFVGPFTVEAVNAFSPTVMAANGTINKAGDTVNVTLKLVATSAVTGTVFQPDGVTHVGQDVVVTFDSPTLHAVNVVTDAQGKYSFPLVNAGNFTVTAQDPVTGLQGQSGGAVDPGRTAQIPIRLLGTGTVNVQVQGSAGAIAGATVTLTHGGFPSAQRQRVTAADGTVSFSGGDAIAEGPFSVSAFDATSGVTGFASGTIAKPDATVNVVVTLPDQAGTVRGRFLTPDGKTAVANAQVHLSSASGDAFTTTDGQGQFAFQGVRLGAFTVDAFDSVSARRGRSTGQLTANQQVVTADIIEVAQGTVTGFVRLSKDLSPVASADVSLSVSGVFGATLRTTSGTDGAFTFPGVSAGDFSLTARDSTTGISGSASGTLATEGQTVAVDVVLEVPVVGRIQGTVRQATGSIALGAQVQLDGAATTTVDNNGFYFFDGVPLGQHSLLATAAVGADAGVGTATIAFDGDLSEADIQFVGVGKVSGTVTSAAGSAIAGAHVVLTRKTAVPRSFSSDTLTDPSGHFEFDDVPVGDISVTATQPGTLLAGSASGTLSGPGATLTLPVVLQPSGTIRGRVFHEDGVTPASGMALELTDGSQRFGSTRADGSFEFDDLSLGTYKLTITDPLGPGLAFASATLSTEGQIADVGSVRLDETQPSVLAVSPADGATGVPVASVITVHFSKAIDPATIGPPNLLVSGPDGALAGTWSLSADRTQASFTPSAPYRDFSTVSVKVTTVVADPVGKPLAQEVIVRFVTADSHPPTFTSISPAQGAQGVPPDAVIRIAYSKVIDPSRFSGPAIVLSLNGTAVPAQLSFILSNTVAVLTPLAPLSPNATYQVTVSPATDLFGNVQPAPLSYAFGTIDTIPPVVQALTPSGGSTTVVQGTTVTVTADVGGATDIASVDFLVNGQLAATQQSAPFTLTLPVTGTLGSAVTIAARATDVSGNVGPFQTLMLAVQQDLPPTASIVSPVSGATAGSGQPLAVTVRVGDDFGVTQVSLQATGALTTLLTSALTPAVKSKDVSFNLTVPANASPGSTILLRATATDTSGQNSPVASVSVVVTDATPPSVNIVSPTPGTTVAPGDTVNVLISATDNGQVALLSLQASGAATFSESRPVSPPQPSVASTFQVVVPATAAPNQFLVLTAQAQDAAGNTTPTGLSLRVRDTVPPTITALSLSAGGTTVIAGTTVTVVATATDNVAVTGVDFQASGAVVQASSVAITPAVSPATASFTLAVPLTAPDGSTVTVRAHARDGDGNVSTDATLTLLVAVNRTPPTVTVLAPADGASIGLGAALTLTVHATDKVAVAQIAFTATGVVTGGETRTFTPAAAVEDATFTLAVPVTSALGTITLSVTATDVSGNVSVPVTRSVTVIDTVPPVVQIVSPADGTTIDPRTPTNITVLATDNIAVAGVSLDTSGVLTTSQTHPVTPPATPHTENFTVTFPTLPPTGGTLTLTARAQDAAGNLATPVSVTLNVRDVVPPTIAQVSPPNGATGVAATTAVTIQFSEPVARATVSAATITLSAPTGAIPVTFSFAGDSTVTLTPTAPLPLKTVVTLTVSTAVTDLAGNALATPFTATFTTVAPDTTPPRVASITPADGAVAVSVATAIQVTFTKPIDPATVTPASFSVTAGTTPVSGALTFLGGNTIVRFAPSSPLPFGTRVTVALTSAIADPVGNHLADAAGNPLTAPLTTAFTTGSFAITAPVNGATVPELTSIVLQASGASSLNIATVTFSVNGHALPPTTPPGFLTPFTTPSAATTPTLTIVAVARAADGSVLGQDSIVVNVGVGLSFTPTLLGMSPGATVSAVLVLTSPPSADLRIDLSAVDPTVVSFPVNPVVLPAGQTQQAIAITGAKTGNTTITAVSTLGEAAAIVSVSPLVSQQTFDLQTNAVGISVQPPSSVGRLFAPGSGQQTLTLPLLPTPAAQDTPVTVATTNAAVANVAGSVVVPAGSRVATVTVVTGTAGTALITLRAGAEVRGLTVIVGTPPPNSVPPALAPSVGLTLLAPPSVGQLIVPTSGQKSLTVPILSSPASQPTTVTATSSNDAVAQVVGTVVIPTGSETASVTIAAGTSGTAVITLTAGTVVRALTVVVGTPPAGSVPAIVAPPIAVVVLPAASAGQLLSPGTAQQTITVPLLPAPAGQDTPVVTTSSDDSVAHVTGSVVVPAGAQTTTLTIATGTAGTAVITLQAGTTTREFTVIVGTPPANSLPPIVAPPTAVVVLPAPSAGMVVVPSAGQQAVTVQVLPAPASQNTPVTVSSSDPSVATVPAPVSIPAGSQTATMTIVTGTPGIAFISLTAGGQTRELTVIVGTPPDESIPPVAAPSVQICVENPQCVVGGP